MYSEDYDGAYAQERSGEDVFSKPVRAGKRTYFFDVKATKGNDYYLTITESKRRMDSNGHFAYDKHQIFLTSDAVFACQLRAIINGQLADDLGCEITKSYVEITLLRDMHLIMNLWQSYTIYEML